MLLSDRQGHLCMHPRIDSYHYIIIVEKSVYFLLLCASLCYSKHSIAILLATFEFIALSRSQNFSIQIKSINLITFLFERLLLFPLFCIFILFIYFFRYLLCNCAIGKSNFFFLMFQQYQLISSILVNFLQCTL